MSGLNTLLNYSALLMRGLSSGDYEKVLDAWGSTEPALLHELTSHTRPMLVMFTKISAILTSGQIGVIPDRLEQVICTAFGSEFGKYVVENRSAPSQEWGTDKLKALLRTYFRDGPTLPETVRTAVEMTLAPATPSLIDASARVVAWWKEFGPAYETYTGMDKLGIAIQGLEAAALAELSKPNKE